MTRLIMKQFKFLVTLALMATSMTMAAQAPDTSSSQQEQLGRGFICINTTASSSFLSWRLLNSDDQHTSFLVLKDGEVVSDTLLNTTSIRQASTSTTELA